MGDFAPHLDWIDAQRARMVDLVTQWAEIPSGTFDLQGLAKMRAAVTAAFAGLPAKVHEQAVDPQRVIDAAGQVAERPLGSALILRHDAAAPVRVLLAIHMDTVYGPLHPFKKVTLLDENTLRGPAVTDAKGGLVVMLVALEALCRSPWADRLAWEVLINPDEEIGSPGSSPLFADAAKRCQLGLLFEPAFADGSLVSIRKGSGNFAVVFRGRPAHVGRDPTAGRNAIHAMSQFIVALHALAEKFKGLTVNAGQVEGGGPVNVVPELAICRFNLRIADTVQQRDVADAIDKIIADISHHQEVRVELHGQFQAPPKPLDPPLQRLMEMLEGCGKDLGLDLQWRESGGVCDGNRLAAAGLANIDTLGPRGGAIHSPDEYLLLDSLTERAKLTTLLLMKLASGRIRWNDKAA